MDINDVREPGHFKGETFSKYKKVDVRNQLICLNKLLEENKSPIPRRKFYSLSNWFSGGNSKKTKKIIKSTNKNYTPFII